MAGYKYPRIVEFVDALPMTATGKILKRELQLMRPLLIALGAVMVLDGRRLDLPGPGLPRGQRDDRPDIWAVIGPIVAGLGVALVVVAARRRT